MKAYKYILFFAFLFFFTTSAFPQSNLTASWINGSPQVNATETEYFFTLDDPGCPGQPVEMKMVLSGSGVDDVSTGNSGIFGSGTTSRVNTNVRFDNRSESLQFQIFFNKPVSNIKFRMFNVDRTAKATTSASYQDQVIISSHRLNPVINTSTSGSGTLYEINGNTITGLDNFGSTVSNAPQVDFQNNTISQLTINWTNGSDVPANFTGYNGQTIGIGDISFTTQGCALPVNYLSFYAETTEKVKLIWETTSELQNSHFEIEKSYDAVHFTNIGRMVSQNNSTPNSYYFIDSVAFEGRSYYRLKQFDLNDTFSYSKIISVLSWQVAGAISAGPNPTTSYLNIYGKLPKGTEVFVLDMYGRIMRKEMINNNVQIYKLNLSHLYPGIYHLRLLNNSTGIYYSTRIHVVEG